MYFQILGPLRIDSGRIEIEAPKQRALLLALLLNLGRVLSTDRLIDWLWEEPPSGAVKALRFHVSKLRRLLDPNAPAADHVLETVGSGYGLAIGRDQLDATRFEDLYREGRDLRLGDPTAAADLLGRALALWRGEPLEGDEYLELAQPEIRRLRELRAAAVADQAEALLQVGRADEALAGLTATVADHPLDERLAALTMTALYRMGRQADALAAYAELRRRLAEELGVDPSPDLQRLEERILLQNLEPDETPTAPALPGGVVTLLFTDVVASTALVEKQGDGAKAFLAQLESHVRRTVEEGGGRVFAVMDDRVRAAFADPHQAVAAAIAIQEGTPANADLVGPGDRVRIALHTANFDPQPEGYFGLPISRGERLRSVAHGGQIIVSAATASLVGDAPGVHLVDLGEHRLRDLTHPEHVFQVAASGLRDRFPPLQSIDLYPHNLPEQPTSLIGRRTEVTEIPALLDRHRQVTLTGPAGTGKTRLVLRVAAGVLRRFTDGVWWVPLAAITDPALVAGETLKRIGLEQTPGLGAIAALVSHLQDRSALLVFDNCEHLTRTVAELIAELLASCPGVRVLATSRQALETAGEVLWRVSGLTSPPGGRPAGADPPTESEQLFEERARAVRPDYRLDPEGKAAVARICHRLEGNPLAIELAAANVASLSPTDIDARLERDFALLETERPGWPRHQRTLRAALDWSFDLLEDDERRLLARLSVFRGSFSLEAAEAVCSGPGVESVVSSLQRLVLKSMVASEPRDHESRYSLLQTICEYAARLPAADELADLERRHADWYLDQAKQGGRLLALDPRWVDRLEADLGNLRKAIGWSIERKDGQRANRMAGALGFFWVMSGRANEGLDWMERVLGEEAEEITRASALQAAGFLAAIDRQYRRALDYLEQSLALTAPGSRAAAWAHFHIARALTAWSFSGSGPPDALDAAGHHYRQALETIRATGNEVDLAFALPFAGWHGALSGDVQAEGLQREALEISDRLGLAQPGGLARANLALFLARKGRRGEARPLFLEAAATFRSIGDRYSLQIALTLAGLNELAAGETGRAIELAREALATMRLQGSREWETMTGGLAAALLRQLGADQEATAIARWLDDVNPGWVDLLEASGYPADAHRDVADQAAAAGLTVKATATEVARFALAALERS